MNVALERRLVVQDVGQDRLVGDGIPQAVGHDVRVVAAAGDL